MGNDLPTARGFDTGAGRKRRIETPEQLLEEFQAYTVFAHENLGFPVEGVKDKDGTLRVTKYRHGSWTIVSFCHFLGVGTSDWAVWRNARDDLKEAIDIIEARIRDHRRRGGEAGVFHAGLVIWDAEREERKRARLAGQSETPTVAPDLVANIVHPDMTPEQFDLYTAAGVEVPLYTQRQIDAGMPLFLPPVEKSPPKPKPKEPWKQ